MSVSNRNIDMSNHYSQKLSLFDLIQKQNEQNVLHYKNTQVLII